MNGLAVGKKGLTSICKGLNQPNRASFFTSSQGASASKKFGLAVVGTAVGASAALVYSLNRSVQATGFELHPTPMPWSHNGIISSLDHASIRRGYQVYKQVCAACHSMRFMCYRRLVNVSHTEQEAKAEAAEAMIWDGPNKEGEMFQRPGKLPDAFPAPYANDEAARAANNGSLPPDLSYIVNARHGMEDYLFALLTGYCDPPAGVVMNEGMHYNPYFPGGQIGMAMALYNEIIEYEDGTPATQSQLAKDVATFLKWGGETEFDSRKTWMLKCEMVLAVILAVSVYYKRHYWSAIKSRKIFFVPPKK